MFNIVPNHVTCVNRIDRNVHAQALNLIASHVTFYARYADHRQKIENIEDICSGSSELPELQSDSDDVARMRLLQHCDAIAGLDPDWQVPNRRARLAARTDRAAAGLAPAKPEPDFVADHRALLNAQPHLVWSSDTVGHLTYCNDRWYNFAGAGHADRWTRILHVDEQAQAWAVWQQHLISGDTYEAEHRLRRHDGTVHWALARAVALRDCDGVITGWCGTFTDIHALKAHEAQSDFLACELNHRIHNIFAVVEAMLMMSSRDEPLARDFAEAACARIKALARANDYIRPSSGTGMNAALPATLHGLLQTVLAPYQPDPMRQGRQPAIDMSGPDLAIGAAAATLLALVIHELATNAAKYGALACTGGQLRVMTALDDHRLHLVWTETGGPAVAGPPARRGFGTLLADRALGLPLGAAVKHVWAPSGLVVTISVRRDRLAN